MGTRDGCIQNFEDYGFPAPADVGRSARIPVPKPFARINLGGRILSQRRMGRLDRNQDIGIMGVYGSERRDVPDLSPSIGFISRQK